jgi:pSer/pThr/pTyr-binding forkhead associated (FHA) protein
MPLRLVALRDWPDIRVASGMIVVGRHPACDARLDSDHVSRRHCCITVVGGGLEVKDLGSTNGIRINGLRVRTGLLRPGDELTIAHVRYRLVGVQFQEPDRADPVEPERPGGDARHPPIDNPLALTGAVNTGASGVAGAG